ncbi:MAG TPA: hypothetical protein VK136_09380 [Bacillota bacterium]|nr:hypothetical protein [Bacillota bacterium]
MASIVNHVYGIRINAVSGNGSVTFGRALHKENRAHTRLNVGYWHTGDAYRSVTTFENANYFNDYDEDDTPQKQR